MQRDRLRSEPGALRPPEPLRGPSSRGSGWTASTPRRPGASCACSPLRATASRPRSPAGSSRRGAPRRLGRPRARSTTTPSSSRRRWPARSTTAAGSCPDASGTPPSSGRHRRQHRPAASVRSFDQIERPFVLVLDDVHHVDAAESLRGHRRAGEHLPPSSTLVLCGRSHPDQRSLARRRLHPGVVDVTAAHLALDATETDELLTSMGVRLELDAAHPAVRPVRGMGGRHPAGRARPPRRGRARRGCRPTT